MVGGGAGGLAGIGLGSLGAGAALIEESRTGLAKTRSVRHDDFDLPKPAGAWREMTMNIGSGRWNQTKLSASGAAACW